MVTSAAEIRFIEAEIQHINDEKYYEGERLKNDPGDHFVFDWVSKHAKEFRDAWNLSKCSSCCFWKCCGKEVKIFCERYKSINAEV
jgi:hypothetical protein